MNATRLLEPDDLLRMPDGEHYELVDGLLKERHMGAKSDRVAVKLTCRLEEYCSREHCGLIFGAQTGYRCFPDKPRQVRKPDVSFIQAGRLKNDEAPEGDCDLVPDLVVEVISPNDGYEEILQRLHDFQSVGVPLMWVISPRSRTVLVRRMSGLFSELGAEDELSGEDVIPGFTCKIAELFL